MTDSQVPPSGSAPPPPLGSPGASSRTAAQGVSVPGRPSELPAPPAPRTDLPSLLAALTESAERETSAASKARTLLVKSDLYLILGQTPQAVEAARQAADSAPKMAVVAAQARMLDVDEPESATRRLETIMRLSATSASRTHAALLLSDALTAQGEPQRGSAVLDHAARTGARDLRVQLQRLLGRLSRREPLSGLTLESPLREEAEVISELLGGVQAAETRPLLNYYRIARELRAGRLSDALQSLGNAPIEEERKHELLSAHLARRPGGARAAKELLLEELGRRPTRSVVRALAARALETNDPVTLQTVLRREEAGHSFSPTELALLRTLSTAPVARRAGPPDAPRTSEGPASDASASLGIAANEPAEDTFLGAALTFLHRDADDVSLDPGVRRWRLGLRLGGAQAKNEDADLAAQFDRVIAFLDGSPELEETLLLQVLRLFHAQQTGQLRELGGALQQLGTTAQPLFWAVGAMLAEAEGNATRAVDLYEELARALEPNAAEPEAKLGAFAQALVGALGTLTFWATSTALASGGVNGGVNGGADSGHLLDPDSAAVDLATLFEAIVRASDLNEAAACLERVGSPALAQAGQLIELVSDKADWVMRHQASGTAGERADWRADSRAGSVVAAGASSPGHDAKAPFELGDLLRAAFALSLVETDTFAASQELLRLEGVDAPLGAVGRYLSANRRLPPPDGCTSPWVLWTGAAQAIVALDLREGGAQLGAALRRIDSPVARGIEAHLLKITGDVEGLSHRLLDRARAAQTEEARISCYAHLSELEWERQNPGSALLFQRGILEESPLNLPALIWVEESLLAEGHTDEWRTLQSSIRQAIEARFSADGALDANAYQVAAGYVALGRFDLKAAARELEPLVDQEEPPLISLRLVQARAQQERNDALLGTVSLKLLPFSPSDLDQAALHLDASLAAVRQGQREEAQRQLELARAIRPSDFASELMALHLLDDHSAEAEAEALESLAYAASHPKHRTRIFRTAGLRWEEAEDSPRAQACYERCLELNPASFAARQRLQALYRQAGESRKLRELLEQQLTLDATVPDALELELELAAILIELGAPSEAKQRLDSVLERHPGEIAVLQAHAEVCAALGEHEDALSSLLALSNRLQRGPARTSVLRSLGRLQEEQFKALEKAMDTFESVLADDPDDAPTARRLVNIYRQLGLAERATTLLTQLIQKQSSPEAKKTDALFLAELYEQVARDPKRASATLERTRRAWPLDADVLSAVYGFMARQGQDASARMLVARAGKDVERKLEEGRIDPELLGSLAQVRQLSGQGEQAALIRLARAAYVGDSANLPGAGARALHPDLERYLAPSELPAALRALLRKTARALDSAFPIDVSSFKARPMTDGRVPARLRQIAEALGQPTPELFATEALGCRAVPLTVHPSRLLVGSGLEQLEGELIDFLLYRALKLQQLGGGALSRSRPEDGWPMLVALLHIFAPGFRPADVDARKVAQARVLVEQGLSRVGYDDDVPTLALETIGSLGAQGHDLADAPRRLASRAAMLATSGPGVALLALAAGSTKPLPPAGPSRFRFVAGHSEARDAILFCATEHFAAARRALNLATPGWGDEVEDIPIEFSR